MNTSNLNTIARSVQRKLDEAPIKAKGLMPLERSGIIPKLSPLHTCLLAAVVGSEDIGNEVAKGVTLNQIRDRLGSQHRVSIGISALRYAISQLVRFRMLTVRRERRLYSGKEGEVNQVVLVYYVEEEGLKGIGEYLEFTSVIEKLL